MSGPLHQDTLAVADRLPTQDLPARIACGAPDRFQKLRYGERFAADMKAPPHRIDGGRHFTPEDHPGVIAVAVNNLLHDLG